MSRRAGLARLFLCLALVASVVLRYGAHMPVQATALKGMTLLVSPNVLAASGRTPVVVRLVDANGAPVMGAQFTVAGASAIGGNARIMGRGPLRLSLIPIRTQITLAASRVGYQPVAVRLGRGSQPSPARVSATQPTFSLVPAASAVALAAHLRDALFFQWRARTNGSQRGALTFADSSVLALDRNTEVLLRSPSRTYLQTGQVLLQVVAGGQAHDVETGNAVAASLGTTYLVRVANGTTTVTVISGLVVVHNAGHGVTVRPNQQTVVRGNTAPTAPVAVQATALVSWAQGLPRPPIQSGLTAYAVQSSGAAVESISLDTQQTRRLLHLGAAGRDVSVGPGGSVIYLATSGGLLSLKPDLTGQRRLGAAFDATSAAALPDRSTAIAGDRSRQALDLIDTRSGALHAAIPLDFVPLALAIDTSGSIAAVSGNGHAALVDLGHRALLIERQVVGGVGHPTLSPDGQLAFFPLTGMGAILVLSRAGNVVAQDSIPGHPIALVASPDGLVYAGEQDGTLLTYELISASIRPIAHLDSMQALALSADAKLAAATSAAGKGSLVTIDPADGAVLNRVPLAAPAVALAIDRPTLLLASGLDTSVEPAVGSTVPPFLAPGGTQDATNTPTPTATRVATLIPTGTATTSPTPILPTATLTATLSPTGTPSATATLTATTTLTATATLTATSSPAVSPTWTTTPSPTLNSNCTLGGDYTDDFDGQRNTAWFDHLPVPGPQVSLTSAPGCLEIAVPGDRVYDATATLDTAPEVLRNDVQGQATTWTATTHLSLVGVTRAGGGFHAGLVIRLSSGTTASVVGGLSSNATNFPSPQVFWGLYQADPGGPLVLRLQQTGQQAMGDIGGVPSSLDLRVQYSYAHQQCAYSFAYRVPGASDFTTIDATVSSCAQFLDVGLFAKTFTAPRAFNADFDWFDLH